MVDDMATSQEWTQEDIYLKQALKIGVNTLPKSLLVS